MNENLTIWKFPIEVDDTIYVKMPGGAKILNVALQSGTPCIWAIVNPANMPVMRRLELRGTGHSLREVGQFRYVGSFQMLRGNLVFHLFDTGEQSKDARSQEGNGVQKEQSKSG